MIKIGIIARKSYDEDGVASFLIREPNLRSSIIRAGGIPFLLLPQEDKNYHDCSSKSPISKEEKTRTIELLKLCNGIVFPGGDEWTTLDEVALEYAIQNDIPVLGICLGMQLFGSFGDVKKIFRIGNSSHKSKDDYVHKISIKRDSFLYDILKNEEIMVNSRHFYTVRPYSEWEVSAESEDGIVEAIEKDDLTFCLGLQWHPEDLRDDENSKKIFESFINACEKKKNDKLKNI